MNTEIKEWIDRRRGEIDATYDLPPEERRNVEAMFVLLELMGDRCHSLAEFNRRFTTQTIYQEYNTLLLMFGLYMKPEIITEITKQQKSEPNK
jgi:hypothetical protein